MPEPPDNLQPLSKTRGVGLPHIQGAPVPDLNSLQLQARSLAKLDSATSAAEAKEPERAERYSMEAQTHAVLSVGAALRELAAAIRERG